MSEPQLEPKAHHATSIAEAHIGDHPRPGPHLLSAASPVSLATNLPAHPMHLAPASSHQESSAAIHPRFSPPAAAGNPSPSHSLGESLSVRVQYSSGTSMQWDHDNASNGPLRLGYLNRAHGHCQNYSWCGSHLAGGWLGAIAEQQLTTHVDTGDLGYGVHQSGLGYGNLL